MLAQNKGGGYFVNNGTAPLKKLFAVMALLLVIGLVFAGCVPTPTPTTTPPPDGGTEPTASFFDLWGPIIIIVLVIALGIYMRRRKGKGRLDIALALLSDVARNIKTADAHSANQRSLKKFKTGSWRKYKEKADFLDVELQKNLATSFDMAEDFNRRIDEAKRQKTSAYLAGISADKIKDPLAKGKQGLAEWVQANFQTEMAQRRRGGLFGGFGR
jgi:hypothetical protein